MAGLDEQDLAEAIQTQLIAATWPSVSDKIFGSEAVVVTPAIPMSLLHAVRAPIALINLLSATADLDEPWLWELMMSVTVVVESYGDPHGQFSILGGHADESGNTGVGKGLLGCCKQVVQAVGKLNRDVVPITHVGSSIAKAITDERTRYWSYRDLAFKADVSLADES